MEITKYSKKHFFNCPACNSEWNAFENECVKIDKKILKYIIAPMEIGTPGPWMPDDVKAVYEHTTEYHCDCPVCGKKDIKEKK